MFPLVSCQHKSVTAILKNLSHFLSLEKCIKIQKSRPYCGLLLVFMKNYSERPSIENVISRLSSNARLSLSIGESLAVSP